MAEPLYNIRCGHCGATFYSETFNRVRMEYGVVSNEVLTLLEQRVNDLCEQGWRPVGGICAIPARRASDGETIHAFYQAMIYEHAD